MIGLVPILGASPYFCGALIRPPRLRKALILEFLGLCVGLVLPLSLSAQQALGSIIGHIRVFRGDTPPQRLLVSLEIRGAPMDSAYTDSSGTFGFHSLSANSYYVIVEDEQYEQLRRQVVIDPAMLSPTVVLASRSSPRRRKRQPIKSLPIPPAPIPT